MASGLKVLDIGTQGPALKATGVATSSDMSRQVQTSPGKSRQVPTSPYKSRPVGQDTLRGSRDLQETLGGSRALPEAASDHHNRFSQGSGTFRQGPGTFRAVSEGPGTFREQRKTTVNDSKITEIMKIVGIGPRRLEMG